MSTKIWVLGEANGNGATTTATLELLTKARELAAPSRSSFAVTPRPSPRALGATARPRCYATGDLSAASCPACPWRRP
jgi:hypothetical protein